MNIWEEPDLLTTGWMDRVQDGRMRLKVVACIHSYLFRKWFSIYSDHQPFIHTSEENWGVPVWYGFSQDSALGTVLDGYNYYIHRNFWGLTTLWVKFLCGGGNFCVSRQPLKFIVHKNSDLKLNSCSRGNTCGVQESASMCLKAKEYSQSVCCGSGKEQDSKRPFAMEGFICLHSIRKYDSTCTFYHR